MSLYPEKTARYERLRRKNNSSFSHYLLEHCTQVSTYLCTFFKSSCVFINLYIFTRNNTLLPGQNHTRGTISLSGTRLRALYNRPYDGPAELADRDGLGVRISPKGTITFQYHFRFNGKPARRLLAATQTEN